MRAKTIRVAIAMAPCISATHSSDERVFTPVNKLACGAAPRACHDRPRLRTVFSRPKPFLDASRRDWQFEAFAWLLRNCGGFPKFIETTLVLPIEAHFPDRGIKGHAGVAALFRRVRDHAGMSDWPCAVEPQSEHPRSDAGNTDRIPIIRYPPGALDPLSLVATFAHELARYLVESFDEPAPGGDGLLEPSVDLAAVFMGFGLFLANSSVRNAGYQLNEGEMVHALAMFCQLRKVPPESVDRYLNPHLRKYLRLAARDLARFELKFQELRGVTAHSMANIAEQTLPTRAL
jgi:hypothetical protein